MQAVFSGAADCTSSGLYPKDLTEYTRKKDGKTIVASVHQVAGWSRGKSGATAAPKPGKLAKDALGPVHRPRVAARVRKEQLEAKRQGPVQYVPLDRANWGEEASDVFHPDRVPKYGSLEQVYWGHADRTKTGLRGKDIALYPTHDGLEKAVSLKQAQAWDAQHRPGYDAWFNPPPGHKNRQKR